MVTSTTFVKRQRRGPVAMMYHRSGALKSKNTDLSVADNTSVIDTGWKDPACSRLDVVVAVRVARSSICFRHRIAHLVFR